MNHPLEKLPDEEILRRLVALNATPAKSFGGQSTPCLSSIIQHPAFIIQRFLPALGIADKPTAGKDKKAEKLPWPKTLAEQAQVGPLRPPRPAQAGDRRGVLCKQFKSAKAERVAELLATLGPARPVGGERFVA